MTESRTIPSTHDAPPARPAEFIHLPTPGDHYSPATGSAIMTIIHEMARHHAARGGDTTVIVGDGTRHDYTEGRSAVVKFDWKFAPIWLPATSFTTPSTVNV